jgi:membrane protein implicated in regulation of membrane protease activity
MGELWQATADEALTRDERVVVKSMEGFTLRVKRA